MKIKIDLKDYSDKKINEIESLIYASVNEEAEKREYQRRILLKTILLATEHNCPRILITSPTGSGKTIMALMLANYFQKIVGLYGKDTKIAWVSMRKNLLTQTEKAITKFGFDCEIDFVSQFSKNPENKKYDIVFFDEAHHISATTAQNLLNSMEPKLTIGLTATPMRDDKVSLNFLAHIKDANIRELIRDNHLAKFNQYTIGPYCPDSVFKSYIGDRERFGKTIFFFSNAKEVEEFSGLLNETDVKFEVVTPNTDREVQLNKLRSGELEALVNIRILTEGVDIDTLETVFVSSSNRTATLQMAGRVLRKHKDIALKNVVQSYESKSQMSGFAIPSNRLCFVDGKWVLDTDDTLVKEVIRQATKMIVAKAAAESVDIGSSRMRETISEYAKNVKLNGRKEKAKKIINDFRKANSLWSDYGATTGFFRFKGGHQEYMLSFHTGVLFCNTEMIEETLSRVLQVLEEFKVEIIEAYKEFAESKGAKKIKATAEGADKVVEVITNPFEETLMEISSLNRKSTPVTPKKLLFTELLAAESKVKSEIKEEQKRVEQLRLEPKKSLPKKSKLNFGELMKLEKENNKGEE